MEGERAERSPRTRAVALLAGPALAATVAILAPEGLSPAAVKVLAVTLWTAAWWVTEAIPIPAASLLPALLLPALGVCSAQTAARYYADWLILLLLGGFIIARAIEACGLHRRIALGIIGVFGDGRRALVLGFLSSSAILSICLSNTATALMLLPIALSVAATVEPGGGDTRQRSPFATSLLLAIGYGASVGGTGSLIGTPPNLIFAKAVERIGREHPGIELGFRADFLSWFGFGLPVVALFVPLIGVVLTRICFRLSNERTGNAALIARERSLLGPMSPRERRVLAIFLLVATLWITRGGDGMPGWSTLLVRAGWFEAGRVAEHLNDASVALLGALLLFVVPRERGAGRGLLEWREVESLPWGMLFLFGGGFAIAGEFQASGLSDAVGTAMASWVEWPTPFLIAAIAAGVSLLTEVTSNTATTNILMPILSAAAIEGGLNPLILLLPAVLSASFAFMLPVGTAPNAIVFATGLVPIRTMMRVGVLLNILGTLVVLAVMFGVVGPLFGIPL